MYYLKMITTASPLCNGVTQSLSRPLFAQITMSSLAQWVLVSAQVSLGMTPALLNTIHRSHGSSTV